MVKQSEPIDVDYIAKLARIELNKEEREKFSAQLERILGYCHKVGAVDVGGVEPTAHAFPLYNIWGSDESEPGFTAEQALGNAPAHRDNQIVVPKVVEQS